MCVRRLSIVCAVALFLAGCEEGMNHPSPRQPNILTPQLSATVGRLRDARDTIEAYGYYAKTVCRKKSDGQLVYANAASCHNACISAIKTGLDSGMDKTALRDFLQNADAARIDLVEWCNSHRPRERPIIEIIEWLRERGRGKTRAGNEFVIGAVDFLVKLLEELLNYDVKIRALEQQARAAQIRRIKADLTECECGQWSKL